MMQLANSQRSHPPPVPPRPSRQVVAEALKRSPRPPSYPTRQAPPPPNTKPWRSEDSTNSSETSSGRTVIYESVKESSNCGEFGGSSLSPRNGESNDEVIIDRSESSSNIGSVDDRRRLEEKMVNDCRGRTNGATSERYEARYNPERQRKNNNNNNNKLRQQQKQQQQQEGEEKKSRHRSNGKEFYDWENSALRSSLNDDETRERSKEEKSSIHRNGTNFDEETRSKAANLGKLEFDTIVPTSDVNSRENEKKIRPMSGDPRRRSDDDAIAKKSEAETPLNESTIESIIAETTRKERTMNKIVSNGTKAVEISSMFGKNVDAPRAKTSTEASNTRACIAKTRKFTSEANVDTGNDKIGENICRMEKNDNDDKTYGNKTTITRDDCTTVVVIDQPERKIPPNEDNDNIHHQDWLEAGVRYSSTKITLPGDETFDRFDKLSHSDDDQDRDDRHNETPTYSDRDFARIRERIAMSTLQGLPPLPRSLSGFNLNEGRREAGEPPPPPTRSSSKTPKNVKSTQPSGSRPSPPGRQLTTLDTQLAILRKEMFGLRQLDLSLLSQLWSLNESIQEFRQLLQEQEDRAPSPSPSSEEGEDISYGSHPPPPPRRPAPLLHHHRPPRPPRPLRPPASDESPSSEEYGAA